MAASAVMPRYLRLALLDLRNREIDLAAASTSDGFG